MDKECHYYPTCSPCKAHLLCPSCLSAGTGTAVQGKLFIGGVEANIISKEDLVEYCSQW